MKSIVEFQTKKHLFCSGEHFWYLSFFCILSCLSKNQLPPRDFLNKSQHHGFVHPIFHIFAFLSLLTFVYIFQGKMGKTEKTRKNQLKLPKTKVRKYGTNKKMVMFWFSFSKKFHKYKYSDMVITDSRVLSG